MLRPASRPTRAADPFVPRSRATGERRPRPHDHRTAVVATLFSLLAPMVAESQSLDSLAPATRVRIDLLARDTIGPKAFSRFRRGDAQAVIGTLSGVRGDTLLLAVHPGADPLRVPGSAIREVHVSRGPQPRWRSALRGAIMPALAGAAIRGISVGIRQPEDGPSVGQAALSGAALGAAFAATKALIFPKERWQKVAPSNGSAGPTMATASASDGPSAGRSPR